MVLADLGIGIENCHLLLTEWLLLAANTTAKAQLLDVASTQFTFADGKQEGRPV